MSKLVCYKDNKISQLDQRQLLFVQDKQQKLQKLFIFKMNNNGATPRIEKTDTVPVGVVEEVLNNNVNGIGVQIGFLFATIISISLAPSIKFRRH